MSDEQQQTEPGSGGFTPPALSGQEVPEELTRAQMNDVMKLRERHQRDRAQLLLHFTEQLTAMERAHQREREALMELHVAEVREQQRQAEEKAAQQKTKRKKP